MIPIPRIVKATGVQANHSRLLRQAGIHFDVDNPKRDETLVLRSRARGLCYGNLDEDARFQDWRSVLAHGRGDLGAGLVLSHERGDLGAGRPRPYEHKY
ncbi:hypothetical protein F2Q68_00008154 [Brassica cretica]|uniref:Uncharacterized protein n=1 Tax=Brassica cretica TaxID=69181 RepID=A0A8S9KT24_BRACR|nr:hypothetical protein F2Q68_00008154 [Brassica cretica]